MTWQEIEKKEAKREEISDGSGDSPCSFSKRALERGESIKVVRVVKFPNCFQKSLVTPFPIFGGIEWRRLSRPRFGPEFSVLTPTYDLFWTVGQRSQGPMLVLGPCELRGGGAPQRENL